MTSLHRIRLTAVAAAAAAAQYRVIRKVSHQDIDQVPPSFFHRHTHAVNCNKAVIDNSATPQTCRYTTL